jgi:hypothetical protein
MQTSPCSGLLLIAAVSSTATAAVMTYGMGTVSESILSLLAHPISTFIIGGITGVFFGLLSLEGEAAHIKLKEWEKWQHDIHSTNEIIEGFHILPSPSN